MADDAGAAEFQRNRLYRVSGVAALVLSVLLVTGALGLIVAVLQSGTVTSWFSLTQNAWLMILFDLNAGFGGLSMDLLRGVAPLDVAVLVLTCALYLGLYAALKKTSWIGSVVALVMPFLGIVLLFVTQQQGRSAVMGSGIVISLVMWWSHAFDRPTAVVGILASALLLIGDVGTTAPGSSVLSVLIGIGYALMIAWLFLVGRRLLRLGTTAPSEAPAAAKRGETPAVHP